MNLIVNAVNVRGNNVTRPIIIVKIAGKCLVYWRTTMEGGESNEQ